MAAAERGMQRPLRAYGWFQALCALPFVDAIRFDTLRPDDEFRLSIHCVQAATFTAP